MDTSPKNSTTKQGNISKGKRVEIGSSSNPTGLRQKENEAAMKEITTQNNYEVMSIPEEQVPSILEEGEVPQYQDQIREENKELAKSNQGSPLDGHSPTYAKMAKKKKPMDNSGLSDEDSIERSSKKGHKSLKQVREEEAERLKMQGS